jgi:hypothetical protein
MRAYLENASDRARMAVSLVLCVVVSLVVAVLTTALAMTADARQCHKDGGRYVVGTTSVCTWAPEARS